MKISIKGLKMTWLVGFEWFERFERSWPLWLLWGIYYTSCLSKFGYQTLNCPPVRYIVPAKVSPALLMCEKNWFCGKVHLDNFYRLLCSKLSSWIHIGVKRISQACCLNHLKDMEKNCKAQFQDEKENRALILDHPIHLFCILWIIRFATLGFSIWIT